MDEIDFDAGENFITQIAQTQADLEDVKEQLEATEFILEKNIEMVDVLLDDYSNLTDFVIDVFKFMKHLVSEQQLTHNDINYMRGLLAKEPGLLTMQAALQETDDE